MDSWCKHCLFLAYSGACLGLSKQFSLCYLIGFFKHSSSFPVSLSASLLPFLYNDLHTTEAFSAVEKLNGLHVLLPLCVIFQEWLLEQCLCCVIQRAEDQIPKGVEAALSMRDAHARL